ncbi:MAG: hypothetical protein ACKO34_08970 [Vampirovibrionales bacterium]
MSLISFTSPLNTTTSLPYICPQPTTISQNGIISQDTPKAPSTKTVAAFASTAGTAKTTDRNQTATQDMELLWTGASAWSGTGLNIMA